MERVLWILSLFTDLLYLCLSMSVSSLDTAPGDWMSAYIVLLNKDIWDRHECRIFIGISLLSVIGRLHSRVLIKSQRKKGKHIFWIFMNLEKANDRIDKDSLWVVLQMHWLKGKLQKAMKSFYMNSTAYVSVDYSVGEWFLVKVGLRKQNGC